MSLDFRHIILPSKLDLVLISNSGQTSSTFWIITLTCLKLKDIFYWRLQEQRARKVMCYDYDNIL